MRATSTGSETGSSWVGSNRRATPAMPMSARRPGHDRLADLPLVTEWINDAADPPAVLIADRGQLSSASSDGPRQHGIGVLDDEQCPARATADRLRTEPPCAGPRRSHPEHRVSDGQLRDDLLTITHPVEHRRAERVSVERDRLAGVVDPQLRLNTRHRATLPAPPPARKGPAAGSPCIMIKDALLPRRTGAGCRWRACSRRQARLGWSRTVMPCMLQAGRL